MLAALLTVAAANAQENGQNEKFRAGLQLRSNGLYDLVLCPNVGLEVQTSIGLAWQLDYVGAWWNNDARHRYYSNYGLLTELRYYFQSARTQLLPYYGHHAGIYGHTVTYDFEFGGTGWQAPHFNDSYGVGVSYGYSLPIGKRLAVDFTAGLGFFTSRYCVYEPKKTEGYVKTDTRRLNCFGPTKLEASIVWNITDK